MLIDNIGRSREGSLSCDSQCLAWSVEEEECCDHWLLFDPSMEEEECGIVVGIAEEVKDRAL